MTPSMPPRSSCPSSPLSLFRTGVTLLVLAVFTLQVGCSQAPSNTARMQDLGRRMASHILHRDVKEARVVGDTLERHGRLTVQANEQEQPHTVAFYLRQGLVRGPSETVIDIVDEDTKSRSVYVLNDETGEAYIRTDEGELKIVFNADGTALVGERLAKDEREIAQLVHESGVMASLSVYSLAALVEAVSKYMPQDGTSRAGAIVAAVVVIVVATYTLAASYEYTRTGCKVNNRMSQYARDWCENVFCFCW